MQNLIENLRSIRKLLIESLVIYEQNYFRQEWGCHIPSASCGIPGQVYNDGPPSDLLRPFKALSDDTRMRMLKILWKGPHCT